MKHLASEKGQLKNTETRWHDDFKEFNWSNEDDQAMFLTVRPMFLTYHRENAAC